MLIPHRRPGPLRPAILLKRPNRFLGIVRLEDGSIVEAHIGDRGRLEQILYPGAEVWVVPAEGALRRTSFTLLCARCPPLNPGGQGPIGAVDPAGSNRLVAELLRARLLSGLPPYEAIAAEVKHGRSRFDFALSLAGGGRLWLEVKYAAVAAGDAALFPDAPSERAARHCRELAELVRQGEQAAVVLVAGRSDVRRIRPHPVDPAFAEALREAATAGVVVRGVAFECSLDGFRFDGERPVEL